jgi:acetyl esterase/lipase
MPACPLAHAAALLLMSAIPGFDSSIIMLAPSVTPVPGPAPTPLYQGVVPDAQGTQDKDAPHVLEYVPAKAAAPTSAIIICPGGGYAGLAMDHEGRNEATWFRDHGIAAFVLQYRLPAQGYRHPVPMHDGQRAIRWVRSHAAEFNIDPHKIGIMGFSAGGHLASTLDTHFDAGNPAAPDPVDRVSCRPDFAILVYAVISMKPGLTHQGSKDNLLGPNPDPALVANLSNETQVTAQTPPTILFHAVDDGAVPIENSRDMYAALQKAGIPSELHEYPHGGHGFGWTAGQTVPAGWFEVDLYAWLRKMGFAS